MFIDDTIAAIATAPGEGGIGIIRISGSNSLQVAEEIFKSVSGKKISEYNLRSLIYGDIFDGEKRIDEVLVAYMKGPRSYTGEDVVEINCHGGFISVKKILELILTKDVRLAEAGEFTKRAFLNGRIDLSQAESTMDLINAKTESKRKAALNGLDGYVSKLIKNLRQEILEILATIEVNIDYPEYEDIETMTNEKLKPKIENVIKEIKKIIKKSENGKVLTSGIKTVIIGRPNVGKSSLLNRLLDEEKAIVTDIEGTTRDTVEGSITINGVMLDIIDTAGIRKTNDIVEKIGVNKSYSLIESADLVIIVLNNNEKLTEEDKNILEYCKNKKVIVVINKSDLADKIDISNITYENIIRTNTVNLNGLDELKDKIVELFNLEELTKEDYKYLNNVRQISLIKEAKDILLEALNGINNATPVDLVEIDIKRAWEKLGEIIGATYTDELLDQLFSQFCLGK